MDRADEQHYEGGEQLFEGNRTYRGITLVRLENDRIADWRENQHPSDLDWEAFSAGDRS